jgi:PPOX class probable F420-dependent enzyme
MASTERLADDRIQRYLATREVVVLATLGPDGAPHGMAMWFLHTPDAILMLTVADLQKVRDLRRDPRVAMVAESVVDGGPCGVSVRGRAEILDESPERRAFVEAILAKYHPRLERLWGACAMPSNRIMFKIAPSHVRSWGLG